MATIKMHHHRKKQGLVDNDQDELPVLAGITVLPPVFLCSVEAPSMSAQKNLELALACMQREDPSLSVLKIYFFNSFKKW
jgi:translation elongation factor EF-G